MPATLSTGATPAALNEKSRSGLFVEWAGGKDGSGTLFSRDDAQPQRIAQELGVALASPVGQQPQVE